MKKHLSQTLRSLKHRNFRLYFIGQLISMTGTWMQIMAQMWLVYRMTHSSFLLGLVGFAGSAPALLFGIFGSIAADRYGRRNLLIFTQSACCVQALILAGLTMTGHIQIWHMFVLATLLGVVTVFDVPTRQAFVADLVDKHDIGNAIALNSSLINASRIVGPTCAGILVGLYGEGLCFLINAVTYLAVIASLLLMKSHMRHDIDDQATDHPWAYVKKGLSYALGRQDMRSILIQLTLLSLIGVPFFIIIPVFSDQILHAGARGVGLLMGAMGVGALMSSLILAQKDGFVGLPRLAGIASFIFGMSLIILGLTQSLPAGMTAMALIGASMLLVFAVCNTILQALSSETMRGRVMCLFSFTFLGTAPIGNFLIGWVTDTIRVPWTLSLCGLLCLASTWLYWRNMPQELELPAEQSPHQQEPILIS